MIKALLVAFQLAQYPYPGPPMWQQMPPPGAYNAPPGALQSDGPYGPGSPYNAPDMQGPDSGPQPWMQQAPPVPSQGPMGPPGDPWGDGEVLISLPSVSLAQYDGRPDWQQIPPWEAYAPALPNSRDESDAPRDSQPIPYQEPPYLGSRPGGNMDGDGDDMVWDGNGEAILIQWGTDDGWGDPQFPAYGGRQPSWGAYDYRDRYGIQPGDRSGDYPSYWNAYPQSNAPQPQYPTGPDSPYEDGYH